MAEVILMPRLSDTMTEGVIAAWHKKVGDNVKKGDLLAEVETDKATMDLESYKDGTLLFTGTDKGGKIQVNDLLAIIGKPGEDISTLVKGGASKASEPAAKSTAAPAPAPAVKKENPPAIPQVQNQPSTTLDLSSMQEVILMPRLSDTMTEGVIADWHKKVGDIVKKGDILADIETDKATMELESYKEGKLLFAGAEKGQKIAVNDLLAIIGEEGKVNVQQIVDAAKNKGSVQETAKAPNPEPVVSKTVAEPAANAPQSLNGDSRIKASPLAKKLASEKGIDLSQLLGSGDYGRIVKKDVTEFKPSASTPSAQKGTTVSATPSGEINFEDVPVSQMRKTIAKRLTEAKFTAPEFYLTIQVDMDQAVNSRAKINETAPVKISFNDFVLKATALALKKHPAVNSSWLGEKIRVNHHVNIGVAVAVEDGLLVPVVRFADTKSLSQISTEVKDFATRAKNKKLQPSDWEGSTFTISNLGMFGMDEFTAIINPPDSCILAISSIQQIPVVKNGSIVPGNVMKLTMTCDHRVVDGATGAAFLQTLKGLLEEPLRMLV